MSVSRLQQVEEIINFVSAQSSSSVIDPSVKGVMSANWNFRGQLVLVTGSTKGIGKCIANAYAKAGANVIVHSRSQKDCDTVAKEFTDKYVKSDETKADDIDSTQRIYGIAGDLSKADDCNALIAAIEKIGHLHVLVNNAGIFWVAPFEELSDDDWNKIWNVNVMSNVRLSRAFLPKMLAKDEKTGKAKGGNIVMLSSECGVRSLPHMIHYSVSKAAQINLARGLAQSTKGVPNVRINSLLPGPTWTEGVKTYMEGIAKKDNVSLEVAIADYFKTHEPNSLRQDFLKPDEVAQSCLFLSSDAASAVEGSSQRVDAGLIYHI